MWLEIGCNHADLDNSKALSAEILVPHWYLKQEQLPRPQKKYIPCTGFEGYGAWNAFFNFYVCFENLDHTYLAAYMDDSTYTKTRKHSHKAQIHVRKLQRNTKTLKILATWHITILHKDTRLPVCIQLAYLAENLSAAKLNLYVLYAFHDHWILRWLLSSIFFVCGMEKEGSFVDLMYLFADGMFKAFKSYEIGHFNFQLLQTYG